MDEDIDRLTGSVIGKFRLLHKLGEGGMGSVYLAERVEDFEQQVALKLALEGLQNETTLLRFRVEQQALAGLQHPNIVQMVDAGVTPDGVPYLAMDYVDGEALDAYCDRRELSIRERIELFLQVIEAVDYAHRRFLIHCDLKFSNILVATGDGTTEASVKLLDFGVSKLLQPEIYGMTEGATKATLRPFTPEYASPEQLKLDLLTTATDLYSGGVVLYKLLTGSHPFEALREEPVKLLRAICESQPDSPSRCVRRMAKDDPAAAKSVATQRSTSPATLADTLSGDLDAIVLKAISKEPSERYSTAALLGRDLRAYLNQQPVEARAPTWTYHAHKFLARHRGAVSLAALAGLLFVSGLGTWLWQSWRAEASRARAEARFRDVRQLTNTLLFDFYEAVAKLPGATSAQENLVRWSLEYLDDLGRRSSRGGSAAIDAGLQLEIAEGYRKLGDILGNPYQNNLGKPQEGIEAHTKGLAIVEPLMLASPGEKDPILMASKLHGARSQVLWLLDEGQRCLSDARESIRLIDPLAERFPDDYDVQMTAALRHELLADLVGGSYSVEMNMEEAHKHLQAAIRYAGRASAADPSQIRPRRGQLIYQYKLAELLALDDPSAALREYEDARAKLSQLPEAAQKEANSQRLRQVLLRSAAWCFTALGRYQDSIDRLKMLEPEYREAVQLDPANEQARFDLAVLVRERGEANIYAKRYAQCADDFAEVVSILEPIVASSPARERRGALAEALLFRGICLAKSGREAEAEPYSRQSIHIFLEETASEDTADSLLVRAADAMILCLPESLRRPGVALKLIERRYTDRIADDSFYLMLKADALKQLGRRDEARETVQKAIGNTSREINVNTWNRLQEIAADL